MKKVLEAFQVDQSKIVSAPLATHFKLDTSTLPRTNDKEEYMEIVLMYAMVCTRPNLAHSVSVVSRFMSNLGKAY